MTPEILPSPTPRPAGYPAGRPVPQPAPLFAPTPKAAQRVLEFFTAQINNDHTRKAYLVREPRGTRASHARNGRRAEQACHRGWTVYGKWQGQRFAVKHLR